MGVPAFYRWCVNCVGEMQTIVIFAIRRLTQKYPKIVLFNIEKARADEPDLEYDNLYIDMNGLIHPCSHPEDHEPPSTEYEMYQNIAKYVDRLVAAIRPKRLLYLSVDGVAPRAKMNQQRERRYRSAQEKADRKELAESIIAEKFPDYRTPQSLAWDSNVITPGTEFMQNLMTFLRDYIEQRMRTHELWRNVKVIFSDSSVPGEGEHKIMKYIRAQRAMPGYNPNMHHVIHGLDADLIMLALATHEPNFSILREEFVYTDHRNKKHDSDKTGDSWLYAKKLECVQIGALREYLANDFFFMEELLEDFSLERVIDDFVFLCFFVGNDFLPHMPTGMRISLSFILRAFTHYDCLIYETSLKYLYGCSVVQ
jgi:5'-3' exoribonuclease 2